MLGSASASVNLSAAVTASQLYRPYGGVRYASGILPTDYGFTHQRADATTGLDDYAARWYDPLAGQFTSADTTLAGGLNRYAYVAGNPETRTDPSGHLYASQRSYSRSLAMWQSQNQPHTYYGSVKAFVSDLPQFLFGTDTLRQAFHTLFQDPKASLGDKAKALGVAGLTVFTDTLTAGSLFVGEPEVGADVRTFDEGLLAADDTKAAVAATTDGVVTDGVVTDGVATDGVATDGVVTDGLAGDGSGGGVVGETSTSSGRKFTRIWRAVKQEELPDINAGKYVNPPGIETKYFSTSQQGAENYARQAFGQFGDTGHYWLTSGKIPQSLLSDDMSVSVDRGIDTLVIPSDLLPAIRDVVLHGYII